MAGKLIIDTIQTEASFLQLNVASNLIATMNANGIFSTTGTKMIGTDGSVGAATIANTAITGLITNAQIDTVANTKITGNITSSQIAANAVTQTAIASGVAGTGPAFSAYRLDASGNQTITDATQTKVAFTGEFFDTASCYDSTTNYRFTPNVAGYYHISATIPFRQTDIIDSVVQLNKNGDAIRRGTEYYTAGGSTTDAFGYSLNCLIYMNGTTDYLEVYIYGDGNGNGYIPPADANGYAGAYFEGILVRAA